MAIKKGIFLMLANQWQGFAFAQNAIAGLVL